MAKKGQVKTAKVKSVGQNKGANWLTYPSNIVPDTIKVISITAQG